MKPGDELLHGFGRGSDTEAGLITAASLGDAAFKADYGVKYAYAAGAMYKGIASPAMVAALAKASLLGFLGTGGLRLQQIESAISLLSSQFLDRAPWGVNLLAGDGAVEAAVVDLCIKYDVRNIEAAAYVAMSPELVRLRLSGARLNPQGIPQSPRRILAKVSRPEVAASFMSPAPDATVAKLLERGQITREEAELATRIPLADDLCVEADSGGHTDRGVAYALTPAIMGLRDRFMAERAYPRRIRVGAAGGIGTPEAAAAAFVMGADFVLTGSINQCTVEAGTSDAVKSLLQDIEVQDTGYAPAGDMFELGAKVQVVRRGLLFPARANRLHQLYERLGSLAELDAASRRTIEEKYFRKSFDDVWAETRDYYLRKAPEVVADAEKNPKRKMALIFRWYFVHTTRLAVQGIEEQRVDYQIHCGPALGSFNQWVRGTAMEAWQDRRVADIAELMMVATADLLNRRFRAMTAPP